MFLLNPSLQGSESYTEESVERLYESEVMDDSRKILPVLPGFIYI